MEALNRLACFKAYDVRGRIPDQINADISYKIGLAMAGLIEPGSVVVGRDVRPTSQEFAEALTKGLLEAGFDVIDIGLCGTEVVYFATSFLKAAGGIMVTASHNPIDYNGMKFVREQSKPISSDTGLLEIERRVREEDFTKANRQGSRSERSVLKEYAAHILTYIDPALLSNIKIVSNPGNGCAGPLVEALEPHLPFELIKIQHEPDGSFPNGIPNPLLEENRPPTTEAVKASGAAFGVAWDGDCDRCFLFDERGDFVEGYYIVGLLAKGMLVKSPGSAIIHDPRLTWNTIDIVEAEGGTAIVSKTGHAFIKEIMREKDAVYGGEMSAHHYFRDFAYCDSGMIPWLLIAQEVCRSGKSLSELIKGRKKMFPCSGEINRRIDDPDAAIERVRAQFGHGASQIDEIDGVSMCFGNVWRFNIRKSQTEPILRLNVESSGDEPLMRERTAELLALIDG